MSGGQCTLTCLPRHLDAHHCLSVNVSTLKRYRSALSDFVAFLVQRRANPTCGAELDQLVLEFKQEQSLTLSNLELLVASLEFHLPVLKGQLVYTKRASKGLTRTRSIQHTVPLCSEPAKLLALHLTALGKHRIALGLVLQCLTGLRPSDLLGLREQHVFRPTSSCPRFIFRLGVGTGTKVQREQTLLFGVGAGFAGIKAFVALGALHRAKRIAFSSVIFPVSGAPGSSGGTLGCGGSFYPSFTSGRFCHRRKFTRSGHQ